MVGEQGERATFEVSIKMVHGPYCSLHLQKEWCVIFFVLLQLPARVGQDMMISIGVELRQDGPQPSRFLLVAVAAGSVRDQRVGSVSPGVGHHGLGQQDRLQFLERSKSIGWKWTPFPFVVFSCQLG